MTGKHLCSRGDGFSGEEGLLRCATCLIKYAIWLDLCTDTGAGAPNQPAMYFCSIGRIVCRLEGNVFQQRRSIDAAGAARTHGGAMYVLRRRGVSQVNSALAWRVRSFSDHPYFWHEYRITSQREASGLLYRVWSPSFS